MIARRKNYALRQKVYIKIVIMNSKSNIQKYENSRKSQEMQAENCSGNTVTKSGSLNSVQSK